jgi:hypothetical protein
MLQVSSTLVQIHIGHFVDHANSFTLSVAGLPKPRRKHAVVMAKFAHEILQAMKTATSELDSQLGPGTAELAIRIGVSVLQHS